LLGQARHQNIAAILPAKAPGVVYLRAHGTGDRGRAEDAIHTAFANLLQRESLPWELEPYMYRAVRNEALQERRLASREIASEGLFERVAQGSATSAEDTLNVAFEVLSDDERECVVLKGLNGLTFREIADVRQVPLNTAASWYRRGIAKLRVRIQELESP
jgi:RNA polymerase sigma factor (sigma-70 family)